MSQIHIAVEARAFSLYMFAIGSAKSKIGSTSYSPGASKASPGCRCARVCGRMRPIRHATIRFSKPGHRDPQVSAVVSLCRAGQRLKIYQWHVPACRNPEREYRKMHDRMSRAGGVEAERIRCGMDSAKMTVKVEADASALRKSYCTGYRGVSIKECQSMVAGMTTVWDLRFLFVCMNDCSPTRLCDDLPSPVVRQPAASSQCGRI